MKSARVRRCATGLFCGIVHGLNGAEMTCIAGTVSRRWLSELDDNWSFERAHAAWLTKIGLDYERECNLGFLRRARRLYRIHMGHSDMLV